MALVWRKPILLTGAGLSLVWWGWESLHLQWGQLGEWGLWSSLALAGGAWLLQPKSRVQPQRPRQPLTPEQVQQSLQTAAAGLRGLEQEVPPLDLAGLKENLATLPQQLGRSHLRVAIAGRRKVGKTSLKNLLKLENLEFIEAAPLLTESEVKTPMLEAEVFLFLVDGDLTDSEWQLLQGYHRSYQRLLLLYNKQDRYKDAEKALIVQQLRERVKSILDPEDVIAIAAAPQPLKVRQHQADGQVKEWLETAPPDLGSLNLRLTQILDQEKGQLLLATVWRKSQAIQEEVKGQRNQLRRKQALPIVENYQWLSAATAFANPVATIDLLATAAISGQMILDLGKIYQQKLCLSQAQTLASILGKLMLQLGLVELSSQAIASLLKGHALTYVAGGSIQGISAAYLTRLAGLSSIEYFQELETPLTPEIKGQEESLRQKLQQVWDQNQRLGLLPNLVKQVLEQNPLALAWSGSNTTNNQKGVS